MTMRSAAGRFVARVKSRLRGSKTREPRYDPNGVEHEDVVLGAEGDPRHDLPETEAGKIASTFADVVEGGDLAELGDLLADEVVYLVPGRSAAAGLHRGHEAVAQVLHQETSEDTIVSIVEVTEVIAAGTRAVVVVRYEGTVGGQPFDYETVFHLRTSNGAVVAITEYSGDQYRADRVARKR